MLKTLSKPDRICRKGNSMTVQVDALSIAVRAAVSAPET